MSDASAVRAAAEAAVPAKPDLEIKTQGTRAPGVDFAASAATLEQRKQAIRKAREAARVSGAAPMPAEPLPTGEAEQMPPEREDVASIEIELPDGRNCVLVEKNNLNLRIARLLAGEPGAAAIQYDVRALLSVVEIGGRAPPTIDNNVQLFAWMQQLGDDTVDVIRTTHLRTWPPLTVSDLVVLKKTLKTPISVKSSE